jgi:cyanophycinase
MVTRRPTGTLALVGGGEFRDGCRDFDAELLAVAGVRDVFVVPAAAAFGTADKVLAAATEYFEGLGARVRPVAVLHRDEAQDPKIADAVRHAGFVYVVDGSPLHLRSVLKGSALFDAIAAGYQSGAVIAASGAGATVLGDPMVDPRGGAYTVGLGLVRDLAVFPYHGTAADHLRERSIELLRGSARLVGIDEETALIRDPSGQWRVAGAGVVTFYSGSDATVAGAGPLAGRAGIPALP